jgi:hypothetical protein
MKSKSLCFPAMFLNADDVFGIRQYPGSTIHKVHGAHKPSTMLQHLRTNNTILNNVGNLQYLAQPLVQTRFE